MRASSNRKLAEALGVSETAVRKALAAGRISREAGGGFDIARVKRQWPSKCRPGASEETSQLSTTEPTLPAKKPPIVAALTPKIVSPIEPPMAGRPL